MSQQRDDQREGLRELQQTAEASDPIVDDSDGDGHGMIA